MNQVALLTDPVQFPHNLFHKALTWAQLHDAAFRVVVIAEEKFSLLESGAEQHHANEEAIEPLQMEGHQINVIMHQLKYMRRKATAAGLQFSSTILVQPRIRDVLEEIRHAGMIFHEPRERQAACSFDWSELFQQVPMHKQVIGNRMHK